MQIETADMAALGRRQVRLFLALAVVLVGLSYIPILRTGSLDT